MNSFDLIDAFVERMKKSNPEFPYSVALGALRAKFSIFIEYVDDLLSAIESGDDMLLALAINGVKNFLARLEEEGKA